MERCESDATRVNYKLLLSSALANQGRILEALPSVADAVDLARTTTGPHSEVTLGAMFSQAQLLPYIGQIEKAKANLGHVLAETTRILGGDHEHTQRVRTACRRVASIAGVRDGVADLRSLQP